MPKIRDQQFSADEGLWYPAGGVRDARIAYGFLADYFPDIIRGPNTIGMYFSGKPSLNLLPKKDLQSYERFIADTEKPGSRLRYYLQREKDTQMRNSWELQFDDSWRNPNFFLAWNGPIGMGSSGVYGRFMTQIDFSFHSWQRKLQLRSLQGGNWSLEVLLSDPSLKKILAHTSELTAKTRANLIMGMTSQSELSFINRPFSDVLELARQGNEELRRLVRIENAFMLGSNTLGLDIYSYQGRRQIAIPATVTPTRFE